MVVSAATAPGVSLTTSFEKLFLSSLRLSSAATLYGVHQFESAVSGWQDGTGFGKQINQFGSTVNSLTECLVEEISPGKKNALDSIAEITSKMVRQSLEGMSLLDPVQAVRVATSWAQRSTEALTGWVSKAPPAPDEEPKLAADVLAG